MSKVLLSSLALMLIVATGSAFGQAQRSPTVNACIKNIPDADGSGKAISEVRKKALCEELARVQVADQIVPDSPALFALGVNPSTAIRPRSPEEFAATILNNVDPNGNFKRGFAIDTNPYLLARGDTLTLSDYNASNMKKVLSNTQLSLAVTKGEDSEDESAQVAIGLHITPWLAIDPRADATHLNCIGDSVVKSLEKTPFLDRRDYETPAKYLEARDEFRDEIAKLRVASLKKEDCYAKFSKRAEHGSGWTLGVTPTWTSKEGNFNDLESSGVSLWSSLALGFDAFNLLGGGGNALDQKNAETADPFQAIFHVRYRADEEPPNPAVQGKFLEQDTLILSGQVRFDGFTAFGPFKDSQISLEGAYVDSDREQGADIDYFQWSANLTFRAPELAEQVWFDVSAGTTTGRDDNNTGEEDETSVRIALKWAFNDKEGKSAGK